MGCWPLTGVVVPEVSSVNSAVIFRAKNTEDENAMVLRNVRNYNTYNNYTSYNATIQKIYYITGCKVAYCTLITSSYVSACDYQLPPHFVLCVFRTIYTCKSSVVV